MLLTLIFIGRALLKNSSILILDECTANVDHETDALIQDTIRTQLNNITVITIAHRLHTVAYYDYILVMNQGSVAEYGTPLSLINKTDSIFRNMCENTGDFDNLYQMAKQSQSLSR